MNFLLSRGLEIIDIRFVWRLFGCVLPSDPPHVRIKGSCIDVSGFGYVVTGEDDEDDDDTDDVSLL